MSSRSCACRCYLCLCSSCCLRVGVRILLVGACSDSLSLRPVYDIEKISVVGLFHIALYDIVEEICGSCSVNKLDGEVLVACLLCKLSVIVNVLRTDEFSCKYSSRVCYLLVCTVYE